MPESTSNSFVVRTSRSRQELPAQIGYRFVEPLVHNGRELLSEAGYYHSVSMDEEPLEIKDELDRHGVAASALSAHTPLMRPEISVPYLEKAVRFAAMLGAPVVNTDEGIYPEGMELDDAYTIMKYTLRRALRVAERYGIYIAIEPHQSITKTTQGLIAVATLVDSPWLRINYDTGNAYLAGEDLYEGLRAVRELVVHVHAKDISIEHSDSERGKVTGTPVGCACGDGVVDWKKVIDILTEAGFDGVFSVECATPEQAARSLVHLRSLGVDAGVEARTARS
jgi:sugar phosphate isomerase/epimerase